MDIKMYTFNLCVNRNIIVIYLNFVLLHHGEVTKHRRVLQGENKLDA